MVPLFFTTFFPGTLGMPTLSDLAGNIHHPDPEASNCCQARGGCPAGYQFFAQIKGNVDADSVCCKDDSKVRSIGSGNPMCADHSENQVSGASSEEIDTPDVQSHHEEHHETQVHHETQAHHEEHHEEHHEPETHVYEHSDDAYSVQVMGALVALALVVAV